MVEQLLLSLQVKRSLFINSKLVVQVASRVAEQLKILGNKKISEKCQIFIELLPST